MPQMWSSWKPPSLQKLLLVEEAYEAQDATMQRIFKDAEQMAKEQDVLTEFRNCILAAQERILAFPG